MSYRWNERLRRGREERGGRGRPRHDRGRARPELLEERTLLTINSPLQGFLTGPNPGAPLDVALGYLAQSGGGFGVTGADLSRLYVTDQYTDPDIGTTHIYLRQGFDGVKVDNANLSIAVSSLGEIISVGGSFNPALGTLPSAAAPPAPALTALQAIEAAAAQLGLKSTAPATIDSTGTDPAQSTTITLPGVSVDPIPAQLRFTTRDDGTVAESWGLVIHEAGNTHWYDLNVDANTGDILTAADWVDWYSESYNVYAWPTRSPDFGARQTVLNPNDPTASPYGWLDTDGATGAESNLTTGNNADAYEYRAGSGNPGQRADGGANHVFDFPIDFTKDPKTYIPAAVTDLFYWTNFSHDFHYQYGFTEAAGNFQVNDYGKGGIGNDPVLAQAQDSADANPAQTDNAYFGTPPDGQSGVTGMFVFDITNPYRDGDLDPEIMLHEYGHGVSNRLTGGPANASALNALQSGGMGEGWSDFWSTALLQAQGDTKNTPRPQGTYVLGQPTSGGGVRRYPYSYDMSIDPETIGLFNGGFPNNEAHNVGEIWCSTLWDMYWNFVGRYGYSSDVLHGNAGNNMAFHDVMDALKLQPANPSFKDARDAILLADQARYGGANQDIIWQAFARRGMGLSFVDAGADSDTVTEAFDVPVVPVVVKATAPTGVVEKQALNNIVVGSFTDPSGSLPVSHYAAKIFWGDGNVSTGTIRPGGTGFVVSGSHTYNEGGNYTMSVSVTKDSGAPAGAAATVVVQDLPITASPASFGAQEGATFSGTVATFTDADPGPNRAGDYAIQVNWGDGSSSVGTAAPAPGGGAGWVVNASHAYARYGTYTTAVTVTGIGGSTSTASGAATITDAPLSATGLAVSALQGTAFSTIVASYADANPQALGDDITATITWGDGSSSTGTIAADGRGGWTVTGGHTYRLIGSFPIHVDLVSAGGSTASADGTATVLPAPLTAQPIAISATEGLPFSGDVADFQDGNVFATTGDYTATIDWGDGTPVEPIAVADNPLGGFAAVGTHTYILLGSYAVQVVVDNNTNGAHLVINGTANVADAPLTADGIGVSTVEATLYAGPVAHFTDANPFGNIGQFAATVDWGDGTAPTAATLTADGSGGYNVGGSHTYAHFGTYTVNTTIVSNGGSTAAAASTAVVADAPITAVPRSLAAVEGTGGTFVVATFTVPNPLLRLSDYSATIDWGDGTIANGTISAVPGGGYQVSAAKTYLRFGNYPVNVTIRSRNGQVVPVASSALVADAPITAAAVPVSGQVEGTPLFALLARFTDANPLSRLSDFSATIDWGDGTTSPGTLRALTSGGYTVSGGHTYRSGQYTIGVRINSVGGSTASTQGSVAISHAAMTIAGASISSVEGQPFSGEVASFTDASPLAMAGDFTATIDWGDGSSSAGNVSPKVGGGFAVTGDHTYLYGTFATNVTVGEFGNIVVQTGPGTAGRAQVADAPITATAASLSPREGIPLAATVASFIDSNPLGSAGDFTATIDWGDGSAPESGAISANPSGGYNVGGSHTYDAGQFNATVSILGNGGSTAILSIPVSVPNAPLTIAGIGGQSVEGQGYSATLARFVNGDPRPHPASYYTATVRLPDGSTAAATLTANPLGGFDVLPAAPLVLPAYGNQVLTVTVADATGGRASADALIKVLDAPITASPAGDVSTVAGTAFRGPVATFVDANPATKLGEFTATITWGDGTSSPGTIAAVAGSPRTYSVSGSHVFAAPQSYPVTVTINSVGGSTAAATEVARVADAAISAQVVPVAPTVGSTFRGVVATFTSANPLATAGQFSAQVAWGDGSRSSGQVQAAPAGGFQVIGTHTYAGTGSFPIGVTVTSNGGSTSIAGGPGAGVAATVADAPITVVPIAFTATEGDTFSGPVGRFRSANPFAVPGSFRVAIDWGDGTGSPGTIVPDPGSNGGYVVLGSHAYPVSGRYPTRVIVASDGGSTATAGSTATIAVRIVPVGGGLSPLSDSGVSSTDGITNNTRPTFLGHAAPGAAVQVAAVRAGQASAVQLGYARAGADGTWSLTAPAMIDGQYAVYATSVDARGNPNSPVVQLQAAANSPALVIDTDGPRVVASSFNPANGTVSVTVQDDRGLSAPALLNGSNYSFSQVNRRGLRPFQLNGIGAVPANGQSNAATVTLRYAGSARQRGQFVLDLHAAGLTDAAGNTLVERFFVTFPAINAPAGSDYIAAYNSDGRNASPAAQYIPGAEIIAAQQRLQARNARRGR